MSDKSEKIICTIDHANKLREGRRDFDPYRFWLKQAQHREDLAAHEQSHRDPYSSEKDKQQLT